LRIRVLLFILVVVASDPLLRQGEAAADLSTSLAEVARGDDPERVERVDNEAIDEPGFAVVGAKARLPRTPSLASVLAARMPDTVCTRPFPDGVVVARHGGSTRTHVRLMRLLI
jgi:hypothetical protein